MCKFRKMELVFPMLIISTLFINANVAVEVTTNDATTLPDVPSTRGFECPRSCFHYLDNIFIHTVDLWCRCPVEVIHLPREELYHQPLATGSPPLLESEASESMKRYVCSFLYFSKKSNKILSLILLKIEFI